MSLPEQDKDWIKMLVKEAITETSSALKGYVHATVEAHAADCPNVSKIKYILIGIGIMLFASAGGAATAPLFKLLIGT